MPTMYLWPDTMRLVSTIIFVFLLITMRGRYQAYRAMDRTKDHAIPSTILSHIPSKKQLEQLDQVADVIVSFFLFPSYIIYFYFKEFQSSSVV